MQIVEASERNSSFRIASNHNRRRISYRIQNENQTRRRSAGLWLEMIIIIPMANIHSEQFKRLEPTCDHIYTINSNEKALSITELQAKMQYILFYNIAITTLTHHQFTWKVSGAYMLYFSRYCLSYYKQHHSSPLVRPYL